MTAIFIIALLLTLGIANFARLRFENAMREGVRMKSPDKQTASQVVRDFLDACGETEVRIVEHAGLVTDYYDAKRRTLFLHPDVMNSTSAAAWCVALHEAAHAMQSGSMRAALDMRMSNIKATRYVPALAAIAVVVLGFLKRPPFGIGWRLLAVVWLVVMLLNLLSLPVEFNASRRAMVFLEGRLRGDDKILERFARMLKGMAWRDTAAFLRSPVYCLFGILPVGGAMRPR